MPGTCQSGLLLLAFLLELLFGVVCWAIYRGSRWLLFAIVAFNLANVSMFLPQVVGIEARLAGQPATLTLVILAQIIVTLATVGWLSRNQRIADSIVWKETPTA